MRKQNLPKPYLITFKYVLICVICGVFLTSCSPQKRLDRLIKNHPYLLSSDTLTFRDTIYTNAITIDTAFITKTIDTILVIKDKLTTQIIRHYDSIYVFSKYTGDTIYIEKQIPFPIIKQTKDKYQTYFYLTTGSTLMCILLIILLMHFSKRK